MLMESDKVDSLLTTALSEFRRLKDKWNEEKIALLSKIEELKKRNRELEGKTRSNENQVQESRKFYTVPSSFHRKKRSQESLADIISQMQEDPETCREKDAYDMMFSSNKPPLNETTDIDRDRDDIPMTPSKKLKIKRTLSHHLDSVRDIAFHSSKEMLVSAGFDRIVKLWVLDAPNLKRKTIQAVSLRNTTQANACEVCANVIISGDVKGDLRFWNIPKIQGRVNQYGAFLKPTLVSSHTDCITSIASAPSSRFFASTAADGLINIWNIDDRPRRPLSSAKVPSDIPTCCAWGTNSEMLFAGGANGGLFAYDFTTSKAVLRYSRPLGSLIYDIAVHPGNRFVVTAHKDKHVRFSDPRAPRGKILESMCAASDSVTSVTLSHNSFELITVGHDASMRVFDVRRIGRSKESPICIQDIEREDTHQLKGPGLEGPLKVRMHPSKPLLATAGADGVVGLFDVE